MGKNSPALQLVRCKRTDPNYKSIRDRHYVKNNGCIGQQLHYLIYYKTNLVGIISGASSVWAVKSRDNYFGIAKENRRVSLPSIVNNVVFRLEFHEKNLATRVLSLWRKRVQSDWSERYGVIVHGFETFVVEEDYRKGSLYKADNWDYVGRTKGNTKKHDSGIGNKGKRVETSSKLIFCKKVKNTRLSTEYHATWNKKTKEQLSQLRLEI